MLVKFTEDEIYSTTATTGKRPTRINEGLKDYRR